MVTSKSRVSYNSAWEWIGVLRTLRSSGVFQENRLIELAFYWTVALSISQLQTRTSPSERGPQKGAEAAESVPIPRGVGRHLTLYELVFIINQKAGNTENFGDGGAATEESARQQSVLILTLMKLVVARNTPQPLLT